MAETNKILSQQIHTIPLLDPVSDIWAAGTVHTTAWSMAEAHAATIFIYWGVGATGTATLTVEACDTQAVANTTAIAYRYRVRTATDVWGALTAATATGFTTTAGSSQMIQIEVDADALAASGYRYCRLTAVEVVDSVLLGAIWVQLQLRHPRAITATQLT